VQQQNAYSFTIAYSESNDTRFRN